MMHKLQFNNINDWIKVIGALMYSAVCVCCLLPAVVRCTANHNSLRVIICFECCALASVLSYFPLHAHTHTHTRVHTPTHNI